MRKPRKRSQSVNDGEERLLASAPWPAWTVISESTETHTLRWDKGVAPELFGLARELSNTAYALQLELKPKSIMQKHRTSMDYLHALSRCPEVTWPQSIALISERSLFDFQDLLARPVSSRPIMKGASIQTRQRPPVELKAIVRDAWRLGVANAETRPDLGVHGLRSEPVQKLTEKQIYSKRELTEIVRFLLKRRSVPRGETLASERSYIVTCIFLLAVFLPLNRSSAFMLNNNSLHPGEQGSKFDVILLTKDRPKKTANRLPLEKESLQAAEKTGEIVKKGSRIVRNIFDENVEHNRKKRFRENGPLFECLYNSTRAGYESVMGRVNSAAFSYGLRVLYKEFKCIGDDGKPLRITLQKLRDSLENRIPKDVHMLDKARVMNHKSPDTTGTVYETVTDQDHRNFQKGQQAISVAARSSHAEAMVWARNANLPPNVMELLLAGMNKTKFSSCSDPLEGEFAPHNGEFCQNFLACIGCGALAVLASDLYRLASLERRIELDLDSGVLQKDSRPKFLKSLEILREEIFPNFETRLVKIARQKALKHLHPLWDRPLSDNFP
ncbi:hypothetical protein [Paraburkholderia tropica]|uniref:hypothetical protein n=1 Tax=Paraburkholderia tropica TaxID=92647 RepID=UPI002ABE56D3|nr:hypothetical protein [Paraburkholderia tropica]